MDRELLIELILNDAYYTITLVVLGVNSFGVGLIIGSLYSNL